MKGFWRGERGSTLISEIVAIGIIGSALFIIIGGLSTVGFSVGTVEQRVSAENYARRQMELIKASPYRANPTVIPYPTVAASTIYTTTVQVSYWVSATSQLQSGVINNGMQLIRVSVYSRMRPGGPVFRLEDYKVQRP